MSSKKIDITPTIPGKEAEYRDFCKELTRGLRKTPSDGRDEFLLEARKVLSQKSHKALKDAELALAFSKSLTIDLLLQEWQMKITRDRILLEYESTDQEENALSEEKERVRKRHLLARDEQLREKAVQDFIQKMERKKLTNKGWHSIFSLMRDGRELTGSLLKARDITDPSQRQKALKRVIKPYIQFAERDEECEHTGFKLSEIWRYFRHTWVNEYKTLPGRSISILIRDAAAKNHPVIGIAALGSAVAQQGVRDRWIGWEPEEFLIRLLSNPNRNNARWLIDNLNELLKEVYMADLIAEGIFTRSDLKKPSEEIVERLKTKSEKFRSAHVKYPQKSELISKGENINWKKRAKTFLFKSKRCALIADVLSILLIFQKSGITEGTGKKLDSALRDNARVHQAISKLLRRVKARRVGIDMMDIIVCGSIAPYNHLLGGKLVCMLLTSPEVVKYYSEKYNDSASLIASAMKGRELVRKPHLVLLGTTSLYGIGSSQYNRIKIPAEAIGGTAGEMCEYKELGVSEGFGSFHFSSLTLEMGNNFVARRSGGKRVNSIFGEGANPLIRKIREAFELVRLPSEPILHHGNKRIVYGIALASNFREILLGFEKRPKYYFPYNNFKDRTEQIADYWMKRWLLNRIDNPDVLESTRSHTLSYPITHGARIPEVNKQVDLFSEVL